MITVADIKKDLPNWPDDVIGQWLHYFANEPECEWPPPDPLDDHRWKRILGGRPLSWWKEVTWNKETVNCSAASLSTKSKAIVTEMIANYTNKTTDAITTRRFKDAYIYIMDRAAFPKPVIAMNVSSGLNVLDGNHRMAAFCLLQMTPESSFKKLNKQKASSKQEAWIGTHSAGEVPLT